MDTKVIKTLVTDAATVPSWLNTGAIVGLCVFLASLLALLLGLRIMGSSKNGQMKQAASQSAVAGIGLIWIAIGVGGTIVTLATATLAFFLNGK